MTSKLKSKQKKGMFLICKPNGITEVIVSTKKKAEEYCKGKDGYTWDQWSYWDR